MKEKRLININISREYSVSRNVIGPAHFNPNGELKQQIIYILTMIRLPHLQKHKAKTLLDLL